MSPQGQTEKATGTSYESTIKTLIHTQRGAFSDLDYHPAFRASAIFYAEVNEQRTTHVGFLNYWREKNGVPSVGALLSLRDAAGELRGRQYFKVEQFSYQIDVRDLVEVADNPGASFIGTIEVEIFSNEDLKFAFPALFVFYETARGISYVHTNQRIYNDPLDRRRGDPFNRRQTGFDVHCQNGTKPFVFVINGSEPVPDATADVTLFNQIGRKMTRRVALGDLPPFAARRLAIDEIEGVSTFLGEDIGFLKLELPLGNIFNRFTCGTESKSGDWIGITHSYFDCLEHGDYYGSSAFGPDVHPCFVPVNLIEGFETEVIFYPIMAPANLRMRLACFEPDGRPRATIKLPGPFETSGSIQFRIDLRSVLAKHGVRATSGLYAILIESEDGRIPTRISFGLNYHSSGRPGCNISSSVLMASSHGVRSRSWLWGAMPCRPGARNIIMVSHMPKEKEAAEHAPFSIRIYNENGNICSLEYEIAPRTGLNIDSEEVLENAGYKPTDDEILWYVIRSESSSLISNQIYISADGYVGGDHSF
ncbi:MAG: hypothetical protein CFH10_01156 [Alphaproteobacteria bacterium MarineAlpha4_Bin2]|nr:MAG: hypothetical protein CFH10_01156 [Alphaproteobacteria bacterium MarineAlpha4_Bin2]